MAATNKFAGKAYEGTFKGGEGPRMGQTITTESENPGLMNPDTSGRHLHEVSGSAPSVAPKGGDGLFSLQGKSYKGPQNWVPEDKGEVSNQP